MSTRMRVLAAIVVIAALAGCDDDGGGGSKASGPLVDGATFTYALAADPGSLDTAANPSADAFAIVPYAYDALVATDDGNKIVGNLATKWAVEPRRLEFQIREGVTCSDGSPVTPSVIAKSLTFLKKPSSQIPVFGSMSDWSVSSNDAAGTVTVRLGEPVGFPLEAIADVPIVCGEGLADRKLLRKGTSGSGPYVLKKAVSNDRYEFELRKDYSWGPRGVTAKTEGLPAKVVFRVVPDAATTTNLILNGEVDGAQVTFDNAQRLRSVGHVISVQNSVAQVAYNHERGRPTADVAVRRALTMAIDRKAAAKVSHGELTGNLIPALTNPCPDPDNQRAIPAYDPAAAAAELDKAGWRKSGDGREKDGERLVIVAPVASALPPEWRPSAELILDAWRDLGVEVKSRQLADTAYIQLVTEGDWDALPMWAAGDPNPAALRAYITGPPPPEGRNLTRLYNAEYERISGEALGLADRKDSCPLWNEAERKVYSDAGNIPVFAANVLYGLSARIDLRVTTYGPVPTSIRVHEG